MRNEYFLAQAERLKPELIRENVVVHGDSSPLRENEEVIFDFGNHYVGYLTLNLCSTGHHPDAPLYLQLQFAEIKEELSQNTEDYHGWISRSWVQEERIHVDVLPNVVKLERRYAFRYVKIRVLALSENYSLIIPSVSVEAVSSANDYLVEKIPMKAEDEEMDRVALRTLHNCMQEVFEDGPKRDRRLWLGDLRLQALANYETYRNMDLVKRCLYLFAGSTLEEGKLASNIFLSPQVECDFQSMFDYTVFFISALWDYYEASSDLETLKDLEPVALRQRDLLKKCFDENDLLDPKRSDRIFVDWNLRLDKQAPGQAIYLYGLKALVKIEEALQKDHRDLDAEIEAKTRAARTLFDKTLGVFVSGEEQQISCASQIWMILAGVVSAEEGKEILKRVEEIPYAEGMSSPYAYHHYIEALIQVGEKEKAYTRMHEYWDGMLKEGTDTFWELYNPKDPKESPYGGLVVHSFCHAWSCTPTYFLRKYYYSKDN